MAPAAAAAQGASDAAPCSRGKALAGLIGAGIQRSLTPAMHEAEARHHGLALHYQRIDLDAAGVGVEALPGLVEAARTMGFAGLNITYPCKQAVLPLLDELSPEARAMGAVNTVVFRAGRAIGHNTDGLGWAWGFTRTLPDADVSDVVLLGAGGAGSAIAHAVAGLGARRLTVIDRDVDRAARLADEVRAAVPALDARGHGEDALPAAMARATGLIHATPTGMDKLPGLPLDVALLRPSQWVAEVVYFPLETALLKAARARGCRVVDGGTMAVGQALGAFRLFTGLEPDAARIDAHFRTMVAQRVG